jgi:hypothetical protein
VEREILGTAGQSHRTVGCSSCIKVVGNWTVVWVIVLLASVIPNLGYEPGHLGVCEKKFNNGGKSHIRQRINLK